MTGQATQIRTPVTPGLTISTLQLRPIFVIIAPTSKSVNMADKGTMNGLALGKKVALIHATMSHSQRNLQKCFT